LGNAVFNIEVKSEIIAGAIVMSQKGEYGNYSLSSQLDKFFTEKKQEVLSLL
jgi:helix-turn-helix protein